MTVPAGANRNDYSGDGALLVYPYTFRIFASSDLQVFVGNVLQTLNTHYSVSGVGDQGGGNVTFTTAPGSGVDVSIIRAVPYTQPTDYVTNDPFPAETHEAALDRTTILVQQVKEITDRALVVPPFVQGFDGHLPDPTNPDFHGKVLRLKTDGSGIDVVAVSDTDIAQPITTLGDLLQGGTGGVPERLAVGSLGRVLRVGAAGKWEAGAPPIALTNKTGGTLAAGDVVAISTADDSAVVLGDTVSSRQDFAIALGSINNNTLGLFSAPGTIVSGVAAQGAISRGHYVRKSATSKKVETTGITMSASAGVPGDAIGLALTAAAGGVVTLLWYGGASGAGGIGVPGANFFELQEIGLPATPAAGRGLLYTLLETPLNRPYWLDAGGQAYPLAGVLYREAGNPLKDITNTTTETSLFSVAPTIRGGTLGTVRGLRITPVGDILNNSGGVATPTWRVKYGATTLVSWTTGGLTNSAARRAIGFSIHLVAAGATNAQFAAIGPFGRDFDTTDGTTKTGTAAEDSTADKVLDVTLQWDSASASRSMRIYSISVELL